ncbi:hypothetical protein DIU36_02305 [Mucilaginibacter rubeus]|nr:hypothetical protein DIU36_02305 [Mucilaginibacter rubeus]
MATNRINPAKRTSVTHKKKKKKKFQRPLWMRIIRTIAIIIMTIFMVLAMIGIVQRYCHILSKH